jgi:enoyl-CoA hydratase
MDYKGFKRILVDKVEDGKIAIITLNRPNKMNALDWEMFYEIQWAFGLLAKDDEVRVVIIKGAGKSFSTGSDVKLTAQLAEDPWIGRKWTVNIHETCRIIRYFEKPVIAMVHGWCIGAALEISLSCDFIIAADDMKVMMPEVNMGIPSVIEAAILPMVIGIWNAKDLVLMGETWDAEKIKDVGLVTEMVRAKKLAAKPPIGLAMQKDVILRWMTTDLETACKVSINSAVVCLSSREALEGLRSFGKKEK